ncbi:MULTISPECIES: 5-deoxy-glucuronate isomerase [Halomonas]|uniref:5-deoxy-glucuronate isomerase n=1 Tax=Halomonas casei TaxID=2742613 RepID=A0ABR9EZ33_9GAMM|nr:MULTISPECIES: 5-deoxy-glucuronate isomerase [Halomonas]MBE0398797.1 5-deoxy-glucuronate isomerase [Halomonas casei]PCC21291.1 5-deoxy-glucuronate isomerase [Halomonas sp. JB37]
MSSLLVRPAAPDEKGTVINVTPASAGWEYVGFRVHKLAKGERLEASTNHQEVCLVLLTGRANVASGEHSFEDIGERMDIFEQIPPYAVYLPNDVSYQVEATTDLELAVCAAPGHGNHSPRLIAPDNIKQSTRGQGTNTRHVHDILPEGEPADSLLVVEVFTPAGNWSSYPPHKHDVDNLPQETRLEETYYHRINPAQGFAFQRVYTDDRSLDETMAIENGCCVLVPKGYHPVGAAHGYSLYYLNVMAGPKRAWQFHNDPDHEWMMES